MRATNAGLDRIATLACQSLDVPFATVSLLDGRSERILRSIGFEAPVSEIVRNCAFASGLAADHVRVIPDAAADPRFACNPLSESPPHVRFCAAVTLADVNGRLTGALAAMDSQPRTGLSEIHLAILRNIGFLAARELNETPANDDRVRTILESTSDCVLALDRDWRLTFLNGRAIDVFHAAVGERKFVGERIWDVFPEAMGSAFDLNYRRAMDRQTPVTFEEYYAPIDQWFEVHAFPSASLLTVYFRDVTARRRTERELRTMNQELQRNKERLAMVLNSVNEAIWEYYLPSGVTYTSLRFQMMLGYEATDNHVGYEHWRELTHPDDLPGVERWFADQSSGVQGLLQFEFRVRRKDGDYIWILSRARVIERDTEGKPLRIGGTVTDVTDRKKTELALRASEERYRRLFDSNPQPMWVFDVQSLAFLAVNDAAIRSYGYSREEFLAMTVEDIRHEEDIAPLRENFAKQIGGYSYSGTWRHRTKDGRIRYVEVQSNALLFDGRAARLVLPSDITEKKVLEEQLRHSQKLEAVGQLSGAVAHDFNNLLTVINGYTQLLLNRLGHDEAVAGTLRNVLGAGERAARLTTQLLAFSRKQVMQPRTLNLNNLIERMEPMLRRLINEDVEIQWVFGENLGLVNADPYQLEQAVLNLCINARDAMPGGGHLLIETGATDVDESFVDSHPESRTGKHVFIRVTDTGHGMSPETVSRIFEPFFTTKGPEYGTGLGLSTVFGIVKQSGGQIYVQSEPNEGATFEILLPVAEASEAAPAVMPETVPVHPGGDEMILVVEDDPAVRGYVTSALSQLGYRVTEAANGPDALAASQMHAGQIRLLLCDVVLPKLNGCELADQLLAGLPGLKVIFMSGYTESSRVHAGVLEAGMHFIAKPFSPAELAAKISAVLHAPERRKRVLIIEDEPNVRALFTESLTSAGYEVHACANGHEAIRFLQQESADLVITDLVMPRQEGLETIKLIRSGFPHLKVIAVSGYAGGSFLRMAQMLGAHETMAKPIQPNALRERVRALIGS